MTSLNTNGLIIDAVDLNGAIPSIEDDGRLYLHDGSSSISLSGGGSTTKSGYYMWDNTAEAWNPLKMDGTESGTLDGYSSDDFAILDEGDNFTVPPTINGASIFYGGNLPGVTDLAFDPATQTELDSHSGDTTNPHSVTASQANSVALADYDPGEVRTGTLANQPTAGTAGRWYFTTDSNGVFYDDGASWILIAEHPGNITASDLAFDPATQSELDALGLSSLSDTDLAGNDLIDGASTIYDTSAGYVPASILQAIGVSDLAFDPATQSDLDSHSSTSNAHHSKTATSDVNSSNWSDYEIQKNGTDGTGIINFKT